MRKKNITCSNLPNKTSNRFTPRSKKKTIACSYLPKETSKWLTTKRKEQYLLILAERSSLYWLTLRKEHCSTLNTHACVTTVGRSNTVSTLWKKLTQHPFCWANRPSSCKSSLLLKETHPHCTHILVTSKGIGGTSNFELPRFHQIALVPSIAASHGQTCHRVCPSPDRWYQDHQHTGTQTQSSWNTPDSYSGSACSCPPPLVSTAVYACCNLCWIFSIKLLAVALNQEHCQLTALQSQPMPSYLKEKLRRVVHKVPISEPDSTSSPTW